MTREEAIKYLKQWNPINPVKKEAVEMAIDSLRQQQIVRCKDCKHRFDGEHMVNCCEELMIMTGWLTEIPVDPNGFCSKGERK